MPIPPTIPLIDILARAKESPLGLRVKSGGLSSSQLRRKLYNFRERLRREGISSFDSLSFVVSSPSELLIIKRGKVCDEFHPVQAEFRPLSAREVPARVRSRGKSKSGLLGLFS